MMTAMSMISIFSLNSPT